MSEFDRRLTPARGDIAADYLEGQVEATRFVSGRAFQVVTPVASVRRAPASDAALDTQMMMGERITLYDIDYENNWGWGQCEVDGYVGYVDLAELLDASFDLTHRVKVLRTIVFSEASLKSKPRDMLSLNAGVKVNRVVEQYAEIATGGFVHLPHLGELNEFADDFVAQAEMFIGAPYWWGGKDSLGLDCSGLVQSSLRAAGIAAPRDADMQENSNRCGQEIAVGEDLSGLQRGDLIFWPGHVGVMQDAVSLLHANAHHMMCASEPLHDAVARIKVKTGHGVRTIRRPD